MSSTRQPPEPKRFDTGKVIGTTARKWWSNLPVLTLLSIVSFIGYLPLTYYSRQDSLVNLPYLALLIVKSESLVHFGTIGIAVLVGMPLNALGTSAALIYLGLGEDSDSSFFERLKESFSEARNVFWFYLKTDVLLLLCTAAATLPYYLSDSPLIADLHLYLNLPLMGLSLVSMIVLILFACRWVAAYPLAVFEGVGGREALAQSSSLTRGRRVDIFAASAAIIIILGISSNVLPLVTGFFDSNAVRIAEWAFLKLCLTGPMITTLFYVFYRVLAPEPEHSPQEDSFRGGV